MNRYKVELVLFVIITILILFFSCGCHARGAHVAHPSLEGLHLFTSHHEEEPVVVRPVHVTVPVSVTSGASEAAISEPDRDEVATKALAIMLLVVALFSFLLYSNL
jgi:hypothetical protein